MAEGSFSIDWKTNIDFSKVTEDIAKAAQHASRLVAEKWLFDSKDFVPVLTGRLKDSGRVERRRLKEDAANFVYGVIYETPYATKQHEEEFQHPSLGFFGAAKYLTKPLAANKDFYMTLFTLAMRRFLERRDR